MRMHRWIQYINEEVDELKFKKKIPQKLKPKFTYRDAETGKK